MKTTCPRRMKEWGPWIKQENVDHWTENQTCSFCGSLEPDLLLMNLEFGNVELGPTDKNYKVYVKGLGEFRKFYFQHFNEQQQDRFIELYNSNPRPFRMSHPGSFYVLPFFARPKEVDHE